jgi:hypothetical protein
VPIGARMLVPPEQGAFMAFLVQVRTRYLRDRMPHLCFNLQSAVEPWMSIYARMKRP